eukprot:4274097-Amphidinium_carterae.1
MRKLQSTTVARITTITMSKVARGFQGREELKSQATLKVGWYQRVVWDHILRGELSKAENTTKNGKLSKTWKIYYDHPTKLLPNAKEFARGKTTTVTLNVEYRNGKMKTDLSSSTSRE